MFLSGQASAQTGLCWFFRACLLLVFITLPATTALVISPPLAVLAPDCECKHLEALQTELRNAIKLQQAFSGKVAELRTMGPGSALGEYKRFADEVGRSIQKPAGDTGPDAVDYTPIGDNVYAGNEEKAGSKGRDLCQRSDNAERALAQVDQGAVCAGIAKAIRAHEDFHKSKCSSVGYTRYRDLHPADRAAEEADAYGVQISVLRSEIANVLERTSPRVEIEVNSRFQMPPNPAYTALVLENKGRVVTQRTAVSGDVIRFEGQGQQTNDGRVEGNCKFNGFPYELPAKATIESDGLDAQIRYTVEGTVPSLGMRCTIPGQGSGYGFSMPVPINNNTNVPVTNLPLRDGAEIVSDMANTQAAGIVAQGGVQMSGKVKIRLVLCGTGN
jgi:hypothetical protein